MKKLKYIIIISAILIVGVCGFLYYYFCIDTVNTYVLLKYTPPKREESIFGGYTYTKPEFEVKKLPDYKTDDEAVDDQKEKALNSHEFYLKKISRRIRTSNRR